MPSSLDALASAAHLIEEPVNQPPRKGQAQSALPSSSGVAGTNGAQLICAQGVLKEGPKDRALSTHSQELPQ